MEDNTVYMKDVFYYAEQIHMVLAGVFWVQPFEMLR